MLKWLLSIRIAIHVKYLHKGAEVMISLAEAVKLKSILFKKQQQLVVERNRLAFVTVEKGTVAERQGRTMQTAEEELLTVRKDIRTLDRLVYEANIRHKVQYEMQELTLVEAIELAKQLRLQAGEAAQFSQHEKEQIEYGYGDGVAMVRVALYDPEVYRQRAELYERQAHKLSNLINAKNYQISIDFDDTLYI